MVSPVMEPTLGGLPPLLIMVGGGEILRDEQIYLAHKCANPAKYAFAESLMDDSAREKLAKFPPTNVQLQVWDDLCHVAPTLSFTRPAKFMYRSVAQFSAWALARAQNTEIDILFDDDISVISSSASDSQGSGRVGTPKKAATQDSLHTPAVGRAGDELPPFKDYMVRQQVSRHGTITPLAPECDLTACNMDSSEIGVLKEGPVRKWLATRAQWDSRFASTRAKIHKRRLKEMISGYEHFDGETPPPSALAGRRKMGDELANSKKGKSYALSWWSLWGSKHDEMTMNRERDSDKLPLTKLATQEERDREFDPLDTKEQEEAEKEPAISVSRSSSRRRFVRDANQIAPVSPEAEEATPLDTLMAKRTAGHQHTDSKSTVKSGLLSPDYLPETGAAGKRPMVEGIAVPFTLKKEADTASMITLMSDADGQLSRAASPRPLSFEGDLTAMPGPSSFAPTPRSASPSVPVLDDLADEEPVTAGTPRSASPAVTSKASKIVTTSDHKVTVIVNGAATTTSEERPPLETFVTAQEDLPRMN